MCLDCPGAKGSSKMPRRVLPLLFRGVFFPAYYCIYSFFTFLSLFIDLSEGNLRAASAIYFTLRQEHLYYCY